jgi:hypothetical protein
VKEIEEELFDAGCRFSPRYHDFNEILCCGASGRLQFSRACDKMTTSNSSVVGKNKRSLLGRMNAELAE